MKRVLFLLAFVGVIAGSVCAQTYNFPMRTIIDRDGNVLDINADGSLKISISSNTVSKSASFGTYKAGCSSVTATQIRPEYLERTGISFKNNESFEMYVASWAFTITSTGAVQNIPSGYSFVDSNYAYTGAWYGLAYPEQSSGTLTTSEWGN